MFEYCRHFIRTENAIVVKGFSDAFESPLATDICINEKGGRHFEIDGVINPPLENDNGTHIYRYDTKLRKATEEELLVEYESIKPEEEIYTEDLILDLLSDVEYRLCLLELNNKGGV